MFKFLLQSFEKEFPNFNKRLFFSLNILKNQLLNSSKTIPIPVVTKNWSSFDRILKKFRKTVDSSKIPLLQYSIDFKFMFYEKLCDLENTFNYNNNNNSFRNYNEFD